MRRGKQTWFSGNAGLLCAAALSWGCAELSGPASGENGEQTSVRGGHAGTGGNLGTGMDATEGASGGESGSRPIPRDPDELQAECEARKDQLTMGLTKMRRLTKRQVNNTLRDLLGVTSNPASGLAPDERLGPFENNAITAITPLMVEQYQEMAQTVAEEVLPRRGEITGCDLDTEGTACASEFISSFGLRAYRRPLTDEEHQTFIALYELGSSGVDPEHGFQLLVEAFVQSPSFMYHVDVPETKLATSSPAPLDPYSLAQRLSYFLWNTMPDQELFDLAASDRLSDPEVLDQQVKRMLAHEYAAETIGLFHKQWLGLSGLEEKEKDENRFPSFDPELAASMLEETERFSSYVIREGDGLLSTLLAADFTLPDENLLDLYGISPPADFSVGDTATFPEGTRAGITTQAAFLAKHAHRDQTSVVHRGIVIRKNLLCQTIPPPPDNANTAVPTPTEATTTRERLEQHLADPTCAACHQLIDPLGYAYEHYDAIGRYRTRDGLGEVDASGRFLATRDDLQGDYQNATDMMTAMANASEVQDCVADQWFRFALGRMESLDDACTLVELHDTFRESDGNIRTLIAQIAASRAFNHVDSTAAQDSQ